MREREGKGEKEWGSVNACITSSQGKQKSQERIRMEVIRRLVLRRDWMGLLFSARI